MRAGHRVGGGVRRCSSGVVRESNIVGSELSECRRTRTLFEYPPLGKPLEAKLLKELMTCVPPRFKVEAFAAVVLLRKKKTKRRQIKKQFTS